MILVYFLLLSFGLVIGSFLAAYTYRLPRELSIAKGRSKCPKCNKEIAWYDNIPLLSFIVLTGRCRNCGKKISRRYPLIEAATSILFLATGVLVFNCAPTQQTSLDGSVVCGMVNVLGTWALPYLLFVISILIAIFVIDLEHQLIFDELVFTALLVTFTLILLFFPEEMYYRLFVGFTASASLLILHLITLGRGMGLGDVKLALFGGMLLGGIYNVVWLFLSFVLGAVIGLLLVGLGQARFGKPIPFGPFLVASLFITLIWGHKLVKLILPF